MLINKRLAVVVAALVATFPFATSSIRAQPRGEPGRGLGGYGGGGYGGYNGYATGGGYANPYGGYRTNGYTGGFNSPGVPYSGYGAYPPNRGPYGANQGYGTYSGNAYGNGNGNGNGYGGYAGNNGFNGNNSGNNTPYPIIIPYPTGYGNGQYNGYPNGQYGPPQANNVPQRRFAPANSNYLYGTDGSVSFYATPPGDAAPTDPAPSDAPGYNPADLGNPPPVPVPIARVLVHLPAEAHLWFEGKETQQVGADRTFKSTPLEAGRPYLYDVKARWWQDGRSVVKTRTITVWAGQTTNLDLTADE
jgi:uncharacterized protein (TIGR03000 family)